MQLRDASPPTTGLHTVGTVSGEVWYFADGPNRLLIGTPLSLWNLVAAAAQDAGAASLPDPMEIFQYVTATMGSPAFGTPRTPIDHKPKHLPRAYLEAMWAHFSSAAKPFAQSPAEWPGVFAVAIQEAIHAGKQGIDPRLALSIVMESAVAMSKVALKASTSDQ